MGHLAQLAVSSVLEQPLEFLRAMLRIFSFPIIFFSILLLSYILPIGIARYDFISLAVLFFYGIFFIVRRRSLNDFIMHVSVHIIGIIFETYKVQQLSWAYPETGLLMLGAVPLYSGFMYTVLVDCIDRFMRITRLQVSITLPWKVIFLLCFFIYLNFFIIHVTDVDFRYFLVALSALLLWKMPIWLSIKKKKTIQSNMFVLMVVFAGVVWCGENIATFSGAWLYINQLGGWTLVSPHKLISWYLLGQFFVFIVIYCNSFSPRQMLAMSEGVIPTNHSTIKER